MLVFGAGQGDLKEALLLADVTQSLGTDYYLLEELLT